MVKGRFGKLKCVGGLIYTEGTTSVLEVLFHWNEGKGMRRVSKFFIHINVGVWCTAVHIELNNGTNLRGAQHSELIWCTGD